MGCARWIVGIALAMAALAAEAPEARWPAPSAPAPLADIATTCVDDNATGYATFQSHNQKVVSNRNGIFMTYIKTRNAEFSAQQWRLMHSTDGGRSFRVLYQDTHATNPPALETDERANLYLVRSDFLDGHAYLYRFLARDRYAHPLISRIPGGGFDKYCLVYDHGRRLLDFPIKTGRLYAIGLDGTVRSSVEIVAPGPHASMEYPHLSLDRDGTLYAAWTTQKHGQYLYWDIHTMRSKDGGRSWTTLTGDLLTLPVVADDTGRAERVTQDDEFEVHTWLSSFVAADGKLHLVYQAQSTPPREHYVRYDLASGARDTNTWPRFGGDRFSVCRLDGFFASDPKRPGGPLFYVAAAADEQQRQRLVCLVSQDRGQTWHNYAVSRLAFQSPYSIGGCRDVTADSRIIGAFTDQGEGGRVYFLTLSVRQGRTR